MSSHFERHGSRRWLLFMVLVPLGGCSRHVRLESPDTSPGARYTCSSQAPCQPANVDVPAELNRSGTVFVILPRQCEGRIHRLVIINADSSEPEVDVTCAPPDEPIEPMR